MPKSKTEPTTVQCVADLIEAAQSAFGTDVRGHPWFRGQAKSDSNWRLVPKVHRKFSDKDELTFTRNFRMWAPARHSRCPSAGSFDDWLCLMQHFGLPTRLLDWSASPLVAAYFAVCVESFDAPAVIWCLSPIDMNEVFCGYASMISLGGSTAKQLLTAAFVGSTPDKLALAVMHQEVDLRMMVQQGRFTIHGDRVPLEEHPEASRFLKKLEIPQESRLTFKRELRVLGIRRATLFPDLQSLAYELESEWTNSTDAPAIEQT